MFAKKKKYGFPAKPRTRQEVQKDYADHALEAGHKLRILKQKNQQLEALESEIAEFSASLDQLTEKLVQINIEGMKLPNDTETTNA